MEIKTYAELVTDAFDDDEALTDYFVDNKDKKWISVDSLIYRINEIMASKDVLGIEIVELYHELLDY